MLTSSLQALKFGDRFFFTHVDGNPYPANPDQVDMIKARNLGDILCDRAGSGDSRIRNIRYVQCLRA